MPLFTIEADMLVIHDADSIEGINHHGAEFNAPIVAGYDISGCFKLRSCHGTWLQARDGAPFGKEVCVCEDAAENHSDVWIFYRHNTGDNEYAMCNYATHRFLTADEWEWATCNRVFADVWETFQVHHQGELVSLVCLRSKMGVRWLTVEPNGNVRCDRRMADTWEKFSLVPFKRK